MEEKINTKTLEDIRKEMIKDMFAVFSSYPKENGIPVNISEYLEIAIVLNRMFCDYFEL